MSRSILVALAVVASVAGGATPAAAAPGDLVPFVGDAGCIADEPFEGCRPGRGLDGAESLAVSPDGLAIRSLNRRGAARPAPLRIR